jgi:hypothetical protein
VIRVTGEWSSLKGSNGGGITAKSGRVGGAPVSHHGWDIEKGGGVVCARPDGRKLTWRRKGATTALDAF